jgi:hypothetical protein
MQRASILLIILTLTHFSACSERDCKPLLIPQKCVIPDTKEAIIDNTLCPPNDYSCVVGKAIGNYIEMKRYATELKINSSVCK